MRALVQRFRRAPQRFEEHVNGALSKIVGQCARGCGAGSLLSLEAPGEVIGPPYRPGTRRETRLACVVKAHGEWTREPRLLFSSSEQGTRGAVRVDF